MDPSGPRRLLRLWWICVRVRHTRIAKPDLLTTAEATKIGIPAFTAQERRRMPLSPRTWRPRGVDDILVRNRDAVRRAGGANHPPTFSGYASVSMVASKCSMSQNTYLQWCFLMKMLNWVWQMGQKVTSASGCHRGRTRSEGLLDSCGLCCG